MVTADFPPAPSGLGDYCKVLSESLAARGIGVTVITSSYRGIAQRCGNPAVRPEIEGWSLAHGVSALRTILMTDADVWHFQMGTREHRNRLFPYVLIPIVALLRRQKKVVVTFHELPHPEFRRHLVRGLVRVIREWLCVICADGLVSVSVSYKEALTRSYQFTRSVPFRVIGIAPTIPRSKLNSEQLRSLRWRIGIEDGTLLLSYFGFVHAAKGFEDTLAVLNNSRKSGVLARLIVLGELSEKDTFHKRILRKIGQEGLTGFVQVLGYLDADSVADYLAASDACVLPFKEGVQPKNSSFLAAIAQGTLVITTSSERSGLDDGANVYYALPGDVEGMAAAARKYGGRKGSRDAAGIQTWSAIVEKHICLYADLLKTRLAEK